MGSTTHRIARQVSPCCGYVVDRMTNVEGERAARPGDPTICIACGHWLTIDVRGRLAVLSATAAAVLPTVLRERLEAAAAWIEQQRQAGTWKP